MEASGHLEKTYAMIKPDAVAAGHSERILQRIESSGLTIVQKSKLQVRSFPPSLSGIRGLLSAECAVTDNKRSMQKLGSCPFAGALEQSSMNTH